MTCVKVLFHIIFPYPAFLIRPWYQVMSSAGASRPREHTYRRSDSCFIIHGTDLGHWGCDPGGGTDLRGTAPSGGRRVLGSGIQGFQVRAMYNKTSFRSPQTTTSSHLLN